MKRFGRRLFFDYLAGCVLGIVGLVLMWVFHVPWSALLDVGNPWRMLALGTIAAWMNISFLWILYKYFPKLFMNPDNENMALAVYFIQLSHVHLFLPHGLDGRSRRSIFPCVHPIANDSMVVFGSAGNRGCRSVLYFIARFYD